MPELRIAIVGAGPAGLMLACLLQEQDIPCDIYEAEPNASFRTQGGSLDLHPGKDSGLDAIKAAGLWADFATHARPEGDEKTILDSSGYVYVKLAGASGRPEIDRHHLRSIMLRKVGGKIRWGKKLQQVKDAVDGARLLLFEDGSKVTADLVVGCDGAWSRVRKYLTDVVPSYSGVTGIEVDIEDVDKRCPQVAAYVGQGMSWLISDNKVLIPQRNSGGKIRTYVNFKVGPEWLNQTIRLSQPELAIRDVVAQLPGWHPDLLDCVRCGDPDSISARKLFALPVSFSWLHRDGVTCIGDAAHVMTPFAGLGVNLAFTDAIRLSKTILSAKEKPISDLHTMMQDFERDMFARAAHAASKTEQNLQSMFHPTPRQFLVRFAAHVLPLPLAWLVGNAWFGICRLLKLFQRRSSQ